MGERTKSIIIPGKLSTETFCDAALWSYFTLYFEIFHFFESRSHPKKLEWLKTRSTFVMRIVFFPLKLDSPG